MDTILKFSFSRTSKIIDIIDLKAKGIAGMAFGGESRQTLYVTVGTAVLNVEKANLMKLSPHGTSLFAVTDLKAEGPATGYLKYTQCSANNTNTSNEKKSFSKYLDAVKKIF